MGFLSGLIVLGSYVIPNYGMGRAKAIAETLRCGKATSRTGMPWAGILLLVLSAAEVSMALKAAAESSDFRKTGSLRYVSSRKPD